MHLLQALCQIPAPAGNEAPLTEFLLRYIDQHQAEWDTPPTVLAGGEFQDCIILIFGTPRTAVFAHLDSIGFTVRYGRQLVKIGGPAVESGYRLVGQDSQGEIDCTLVVDEQTGALSYDFHRDLDRGTELTFHCDFRQTATTVQSCYLDNRLGVWNALRLCETLTDGIVAFSCWEEHGGGSVAYLAKYIYETYGVHQALISDITWVTEGVRPGLGVAISLRDSLIPRRSYVERIRRIAEAAGVPHQLEVEGSGGSDAKELQHGAQPWDWCFIGAAEDNVHSPHEMVDKRDIESMLALYQVLLREL
ncbi:M20/M25/M40 family metallo-hydrolase [Hymenobacter rubripertinctus]|uniref:M20/M25/M40 family metallo-hydrolase n=1 Tax=Hymenobacter rubripertinctus TaxID=2029981 RepID=A0A418QWE7_9BACT|nr:M20/M25/M40 family metallo-hydrolase [Hymenobacter rubripertinctus]RIY09536.1 M20/M25/M40 family metallo-hydrolase [Hymenobacter rubripertinctus]